MPLTRHRRMEWRETLRIHTSVELQMSSMMGAFKISRREFVRLSALIGVAAGSAAIMPPWGLPPAHASTPRRGGVLKVASVVHKMSNPAEAGLFQRGREGSRLPRLSRPSRILPQPTPQYQPEKAKALLKEAGYSNGLTVEINVGADWSDVMRFAEILQEDAQPAGLNLKIRPMSVSLWTVSNKRVKGFEPHPNLYMLFNEAYLEA